MRNILLLVAIALFTTGCMPKIPGSSSSELLLINAPAKGEVATVKIGEPLLVKISRYELKTLTTSKKHIGDAPLNYVHMPAGVYTSQFLDEKGEYFGKEFSEPEVLVDASLTSSVYNMTVGFQVNQEDITGTFVYRSLPHPYGGADIEVFVEIDNSRDLAKMPTIDFTMGKTVDFQMPSESQELIYNGRDGDKIKLIYREINSDGNNSGKQVFQQDVTYDLSDGMEVEFKGVKVTILEATNSEIKYIVNKPFSGEQHADTREHKGVVEEQEASSIELYNNSNYF